MVDCICERYYVENPLFLFDCVRDFSEAIYRNEKKGKDFSCSRGFAHTNTHIHTIIKKCTHNIRLFYYILFKRHRLNVLVSAHFWGWKFIVRV